MRKPAPTVIVMVSQLTCSKCNYQWTPRSNIVRKCPKCKSIYWHGLDSKT